VVRGGKGDKDRFAPLPESLEDALRAQVEVARERWTKDRALGVEGVFLPEALSVKYVNADKDWIWFWLFPSPDLSEDPWTKKIRRHHLNVNGVQQLVKRAALRAKITKPVTPHTLRHSCSSCGHALRLPSRRHTRLSRFTMALARGWRYAFARGGRRHTHSARAAWAFGCIDDDDLHACAWAPECGGEITA